MASPTLKTRTLPPVRISRTLNASRELIFKAWSSADHVKRWFCPTSYTIPQANVRMQVGGPFEVLMRSPKGEEHWSRGKFLEVSEFDRLVIDFTVEDAKGHALFGAYTEVTFTEAPGGTRMDVAQTYTVLDPDAAWMAEGAPQGWQQTLDNLSAELVRMQTAAPAERSVAHAIFTLERTYDAPVALVWRALSDQAVKSKWFGKAGGEWTPIERRMDFRVGGEERAKVRWQSGLVTTFDATYQDIVLNERIVYTYEMHLDERKISISLATLQLRAHGAKRTTLKVTEQGAFLDGYEDDGAREHGTGLLLDKLGESLNE